jgi:hypothetical protein
MHGESVDERVQAFDFKDWCRAGVGAAGGGELL